MKTLFLTRSNQVKNGLIGLYCRITINSRRSHFFTKIYVHKESWNQKKQVYLGDNAQKINLKLLKIAEHVEQVYYKALAKGIEVTASNLKEYSLNGFNKPISLVKVIENYILYAADIKKVAPTTIQKYENLKSKVLKFGDQEIKFINRSYIRDFHKFIIDEYNLAHNTAVKNMEYLRTMFNFAVNEELIEKSPMSGYVLKEKKKEIIFLTREELDRIEQKSFRSARLSLVRDIFVFQCYTGMEYGRVMEATKSDILKGLDGKAWIITNRNKSKITSNVPILPKAQEIINKYHSDDREEIFPRRSNQKMNDYLKEIGDLCNIQKNMITHLSRHTFATTICLLNGVSMESTSRMLGHTSVKTTERYYGVIVSRRITDEVEGLREKLKDS